MIEEVKKQFEEHQKAVEENKYLIKEIVAAYELISKSISQGGKILICGNGGSAADAQHIAAELMGKFEKMSKALPVIALSTDTSFLTAWSNDDCYDNVFSRQVEGLGNQGDVLIGISTSGNSGNIIKAVETAKSKDMKIINFLGKDGGKMKGSGDVELIVKHNRTCRIQEVHELCYHIMCGLIEDKFS